jgi:hypothetical protein
MRWRALALVTGTAVFAACMGCYLLCLAPTITWKHDGVDSGDLITAAYTLGVPHPPGYPLFTLLARLFILLPLGDPAYRVNLMSAVFAALTATIAYFIVLLLSPRRTRAPGTFLIASVPALMLALSRTFWSQAVFAEVYSLNALLIAAAILLAVLYRRSPDRRLLWMLGLTLGLGLANHLSALFFVPTTIYLAVHRRSPGASGYLAIAGFFLLGLSAYLYLPLASARYPPVDWGACRTWSGFWWTVSARIYREYAFALPLSYLPSRGASWLGMLTQQFTWPGFALGLMGAWHLWEEDGECLAISLASFGAVVAYALFYNTTDSYVYLIPSFLVFALWLAIGAVYVRGLIGSLAAKRKRDGIFMPPRLQELLALSLFLLPVFLFYSNLPEVSLRGDEEAYAYATSVLANAPPDAIIIADTDAHVFALWYVRYVETTEPAPLIVARGLLPYQWYQDSLGWQRPGVSLPGSQGDPYAQLFAFVDENVRRCPVYLTDYDQRIMSRYEYSRHDGLYRLGVKG